MIPALVDRQGGNGAEWRPRVKPGARQRYSAALDIGLFGCVVQLA